MKLINILFNNTSLLELNIGNNKITDYGIIGITSVLNINNTL